MRAGLADKVEIECEVMLARNHPGEHLPGNEEMAQVGLGVSMVNKGCARRVQRTEIVLPLLVAHVHYAVPGEEHPVAAVSRGHHAVEHIHSPCDALQDVRGGADSHQVTGAVRRKKGAYQFQHLIHLLRGLPHCQTANGIAVGIELNRMFHRLLAQVRIHASLDYGEVALAIAVEGLGFPETPVVAFQPGLGEIQALAGIGMVCIPGAAFIQRHHYVGADNALGINVILRSESMPAAVYVALESASVRSEFAYGA